MNWLTVLFGLAALGLVALALSMRFVPSDPARWHVVPEALEAVDGAGEAVRVINGSRETLETLHSIASREPRTQVLAGSVDAGMITYITRSAVFAFPDYTTIALRDGQIVLYARLRFGKSDLGVNAARLERWLAALAQRG